MTTTRAMMMMMLMMMENVIAHRINLVSVFCVCLLTLITRHCHAILMMITESRTFALDVGQSLRLNCEFYMDNFDLFDNPVIWKKRQHDSTSGSPSQINTMRNIHRPFVDTGRFDVTLTSAAPRYLIQLGIANCAREDSGNYTCEIRGKRSTILSSVTHQLYVRAPISQLYITTGNRSTDVDEREGSQRSATLMFIAGFPRPHVRCVASGGFPPPGVAMFLDHLDITDRFDVVRRSSLHGVHGLQVLWYKTELTAAGEGLVMSENDDNRRLRCVATVHDLLSNVTVTVVTVRYAPVITCPSTSARPGEQNVRLRCEIRARPDLSALFWIIDVNGTTVTEGTTIGNYWSTSAVRGNGVLEAQLHLRLVMPYHFRKYTLVAENSVAMTTRQVQLLQALPSRKINSGDVTSTSFPGVNYPRPRQLPAEHSQRPRYDVMTSSVTVTSFALSCCVLYSVLLLLSMYIFA